MQTESWIHVTGAANPSVVNYMQNKVLEQITLKLASCVLKVHLKNLQKGLVDVVEQRHLQNELCSEQFLTVFVTPTCM